MNKDTVIQFDGVSKKFCRDLKRSMLYGFNDVIRDVAALKSKSDCLRKKEFWAMDEVSFEIQKGQRLGIIGSNGSGKSTMLKLINGIFPPDKGKVSVKGRVGALIAVGAGFHPQLTGRENIYINGEILGRSKREIDQKYDTIVDFADIGDFLDTSVKYYSSGMFVKLGFAVAAHCEPDILLIDEVLAVGDIAFQSKCLERLAELRKKGATILLVSHHMPKIGSFCEKVLYVSKGKLKMLTEAQLAISEFENEMRQVKGLVPTNGNCLSYKPLGGAELRNVRFHNKENDQVKLRYGDSIRFGFDYDLEDKDIDDCAFAVLVKRVCDGVMCFGALSNFNGFKLSKRSGHVEVVIKDHNLVPDLYNIDMQIRTISNDASYAAHREPRLVVDYPEDRYILKNLAGVFQPNHVDWQLC